MKKQPYDLHAKVFPFQFLGEERTTTSRIFLKCINEIDFNKFDVWDGRVITEKTFAKEAAKANKDGSAFSKSKDYELETRNEMKFLVSSHISDRNPVTYLFSLPPSLQKFNEKKKTYENGNNLHGAEYNIPDIKAINWKFSYEQEKTGKYYRLNEIIRSIIVYYGIAFVNYNAITTCYVCERILMPEKKKEPTFCSQDCRNINHPETYGEWGKYKYECRRRQTGHFQYYVKGISIEPEVCKNCLDYDELEMSVGGTCKEFINKCKNTLGHKEAEPLLKHIASKKEKRLQEYLISLQNEHYDAEDKMFDEYIDRMIELDKKKK